ncbi:DNA-directed RNA polymerase specialized sigma24 family protein [Streptomyces sp. SAI-144]|uniref:sigma factor-like helix-turn-helix DNA-binding protein n=1 Tax=Streptomyces sp. SAI-144 TaxID=2940544 RepID=UPI0024742BA0|nr:sigma factor-like helix-turn-helix DNA-binding protein [Streptomyces sp. SAI-144]MDH6436054.1 DNA-directed RNA polymerase specialized sigma24 family protein [Streptomyces sp. SAI-144]
MPPEGEAQPSSHHKASGASKTRRHCFRLHGTAIRAQRQTTSRLTDRAKQERPEALAWTLLKERVAAELEDRGRQAAALETLAFERAIRAACDPILDSFRAEFRAQVTELEDTMGLYAAMARLPEHQFDVMVLQFALGFPTKRTALVMGVCEATVRSTRRAAKRRLAADLGLEFGEDTDDEE